MKNVTYLIERSKQAVRYWWLMLLIGIALFVLGILVFVYPAQSYVSMAVLFGWVILAAGILEVVLSASSDHFVTGRGWMLAGGVIQIILGLILVFNVALSAVTLPIVLGFWLLFRGFSTIGLGGDMRAMGISGAGWTIVGGVLLLLCALWMLSSRWSSARRSWSYGSGSRCFSQAFRPWRSRSSCGPPTAVWRRATAEKRTPNDKPGSSLPGFFRAKTRGTRHVRFLSPSKTN